GGVEWYPPGRLLLWAALIGALLVALAVPTFGTDKESFQAGLRTAFERAIRLQGSPDGPNIADRPEIQRLLGILVQAIPPAAAVVGWPILGMSLLGLADAAFHIRARAAATRGPPRPLS